MKRQRKYSLLWKERVLAMSEASKRSYLQIMSIGITRPLGFGWWASSDRDWKSNLTSGSCPAPNVHVIFIIKLDANSLPVPSGDTTPTTTAQRDGYHAVDICKHDRNSNA